MAHVESEVWTGVRPGLARCKTRQCVYGSRGERGVARCKTTDSVYVAHAESEVI